MNTARSKHSLARHLRRLANRLDPAPSLIYEMESCMTEATAKVVSDMISGQMGGRIGISYVRPDGVRSRV
jgi:hypothetical protein